MPPPAWVPPSEFDEYRLVRRLGHGSMGQVWLAVDTLLERRVAIKFIADQNTDLQTRERFLTEARAIARLTHPNVVAIYRVGTIDGQPYAVTELIEGQSLDRVEKPVSPDRALGIAADLARGLAAAHRAGILHRDLKPANAMLNKESAKLLDFGLAKVDAASTLALDSQPQGAAERTGGAQASVDADPDATLKPAPKGPTQLWAESPRVAVERTDPPTLTIPGAVLGTPYYMAPECWLGEPASRRSDVYSFGALLYELCSGSPPVRFLPEGPLLEVVTKHDARPLSEVAPLVDPRLAEVADRCLQRVATRRYDSGDQLREAIEQLLDSPPLSLPTGEPYRGLLRFEAEHRSLFFGRAADVRAVTERLRGRGLVVVAGESGVGKSSLCRAGVLPSVLEGALGGGRSWSSVTCLPGRQPLRAPDFVWRRPTNFAPTRACSCGSQITSGDPLAGVVRRPVIRRAADRHPPPLSPRNRLDLRSLATQRSGAADSRGRTNSGALAASCAATVGVSEVDLALELREEPGLLARRLLKALGPQTSCGGVQPISRPPARVRVAPRSHPATRSLAFCAAR